MPLWLVMTNVRKPASFSFRNASGTPGIDPDPGGIGAVLDLLHQGAVAVEEYRPGPAHSLGKARLEFGGGHGSGAQLAHHDAAGAVGQLGGFGGSGSGGKSPG